MTNLFAKYKENILDTLVKDDLDPVLVDITNVAYFVQMHKDDNFDQRMFIHALPWEQTWFEYYEPKKMRVEGEIVDVPGAENVVCGIYAVSSGEYSNSFHVFVGPNNALNPIDDLGYFGHLEIDYSNPEDLQFGLKSTPHGIYSSDPKEKLEKRAKMLNELVTKVLFAMTFAHCNTVEYYEKSHPKKLRKANKKRGKVPQRVYKSLDIGGLKRQAKSDAADSGETEVQTALHICRGHFKHYTKENPLFGKYTGTFWCPPHKRGTSEAGTVDKSYNIQVPNKN